MVHNRIIQASALLVMVLALTGAGMMLPGINEQSERHVLRYTDVAIENAPPEVVLGNAIGALKGIIVDILWIRAQRMKDRGLFYEANTLAELITTMQPRFAQVWAMQGHNMAYNISVATHTQQERWEWVRKGIDLIRLKGIPNNPNNVELYREVAYYFMHKMEGVSDDAHLYYKKEHCREWHRLLGAPPWDHAERTAWIKKVADAPETLEDAIRRTPAVAELVSTLRANLAPYDQIFRFGLDRELLFAYADWSTLKTSWYARTLQAERLTREVASQGRMEGRFFVAFDEIAADPRFAEAWDTLIAHLRKKVLRESYNMDAQYMYELTRDWGPIDWRHGCAHTLYWAMLGAKKAEIRYMNEDDIAKVLNNDRLSANAMQELSRFSQITFDPMSNDMPDRLPDLRWVMVADRFFEHLYKKYHWVKGWGPDTFIAFHENFLGSSIRELYRMGYREDAETLLRRLDSLYGTGGLVPNTKYAVPLDVFVKRETLDEYDQQPHVATTDVQLSLYYGIRMGLAKGRPELYEEAKKFANEVLTYFRVNEYNNFINKFGEARINGIINSLSQVERAVYISIMMNTTIPLDERLRIYNLHTPDAMKVQIYDEIQPSLVNQINNSPLSALPMNALLPEPPGLAQYREAVARQRLIEQQQQSGGGPVGPQPGR
ncbi:MAG: hypothetical protein HRU76_14335 [Phycisphaeraceae bacterium]|nr:hypothetical protein [Phycisphaerales bacterium]QOJ18688.1 MAG: hypothetical protein HRU76_14335 [Phycisphaeraceae bacterium]